MNPRQTRFKSPIRNSKKFCSTVFPQSSGIRKHAIPKQNQAQQGEQAFGLTSKKLLQLNHRMTKRVKRFLENAFYLKRRSNRWKTLREEAFSMAVQSNDLSTVQFKTLRAIQRFMDEKGFPPTVGELATVLSKTKASVHANLESLAEKGFIRRTVGKARCIEIIRPPQATVIDLVAIPLLGDVPAGTPVIVEEHASGEVLVEASLVGRESCFALKVTGESMIDADILDGDVVVVRKQQLAVSGEIVVACIDGEVTVKRLDVTRDAIKLLPENRDFNPIVVKPSQDLKILGKVIATRRVIPAPKQIA